MPQTEHTWELKLRRNSSLRMFWQDKRGTINITMMTNDNINNYTMTITTEEQIKINVKYLVWLYAKSKERKKQHRDVFDTKRAVELVIRDAGGEEALKELFLKEQDEKIIDELKKFYLVIAEG